MSDKTLAIEFLTKGMKAACNEARKWVGSTSPNPPVGASALDTQGRIIAVAAHRRAGSDHAETALLKMCVEQSIMPQVHTMCVTLEPCTHYGRTPPCSEAIIRSGIKHVAIGIRDPNPHVEGGGIEALRGAGIIVSELVEQDLCRNLIHVFLYHAVTGRPFITVKRAFDFNNSMIPPSGHKTFTSRESLILSHRLRKKADAILTGSGTILSDKPLFTVRHVDDFTNKGRILAILDNRGRVPQSYLEDVANHGLKPLLYTDLDKALADLENLGVRDILVESGPKLSQSVIDSQKWALIVDVYQGKTDQVNVTLNSSLNFIASSNLLDLDSLLPL